MEIRLAGAQDIDAWMALVEQVRDIFPGLETAGAMAEHRATVLHFVQKASAVCAVDEGRILGALLFSKENSMLCFLVVDPACHRQHIGRKLVQFMLTQMGEWENVTVTTYRDGDPNGKAARAFYKRLGFSEGKLAEEFGCPVLSSAGIRLEAYNRRTNMSTENRAEGAVFQYAESRRTV